MDTALSKLSGKWHNQHGSELDLEVAEDGRVTGRFASGAGLAKGKSCEITGFASGDLVAFAVNFVRYGSLTSWTGHWTTTSGSPVIHASWHMAVASPTKDDPEVFWKGVWTGTDVFRPGPAGERVEFVAVRPSHPLPEFP